jgi:hypothetical protein
MKRLTASGRGPVITKIVTSFIKKKKLVFINFSDLSLTVPVLKGNVVVPDPIS